MEKSFLDWIALLLVIIGALNWGLVGIFNLDLVDYLFNGVMIVARILYVLVGLSGIYLIYFATKN